MKRVLLTIISCIAFIILRVEAEKLTISIIVLKVLSLIWLWIIIKANNYFYQGE